MATRVGVAKIWMNPFDRPTPKTPSWVQNSETYLKCELSYCDFCVEISKFSLPWQRGWSDTNFTYTLKSADPKKNFIWRKNLDDISYTSWAMADFLIKSTHFCYHGNKGGSSENLNDFIWSADPQNPSLVPNFGTYLKWELSYSKFCVEISKFSFPWQQGLVLRKFHLYS